MQLRELGVVIHVIMASVTVSVSTIYITLDLYIHIINKNIQG